MRGSARFRFRPLGAALRGLTAAALAFTPAAGALGAERHLRAGSEGRGAPLLTAQVETAPDVRDVVAWSKRTGDHQGGPFLVVDKRTAQLYVFTAEGRPVATSPVLLGAARGDDSVPGIGERRIADIRPHERTTPAGRFVAEAGRNLQGEEIVWIDYDAAVSMHRVRATNPRERRLERLATKTAADNRISYGCINVPAAFFDRHVQPLFVNGRRAIVYVLPEVRSLRDVFGVQSGPWPRTSASPPLALTTPDAIRR